MYNFWLRNGNVPSQQRLDIIHQHRRNLLTSLFLAKPLRHTERHFPYAGGIPRDVHRKFADFALDFDLIGSLS